MSARLHSNLYAPAPRLHAASREQTPGGGWLNTKGGVYPDRTEWSVLMQAANRSKVEIEVVRADVEPLREQSNRFFQLHQREPDLLDFFAGERLLVQTPDGLPFHELADELDEAKNELDDRALDFLRIRVPAKRLLPAFHLYGAGPHAPLFRASGGPLLRHAVLRFFGADAAGPPMTFLISLIKSCGRHGLVITMSQPALFALSE